MIDLIVPSKFGEGTMVRILKASRQFAPQGVHKSVNLVLAQNALRHNVSQVLETNFGLGVADSLFIIGSHPSGFLRVRADSPSRVRQLYLKD